MNEDYQNLITEALDEIDPELSVKFSERSADNPAIDIEIIKDFDTPFEESIMGAISYQDLDEGTYKETLKILVNQLDVRLGVSDSS